jgi:NAD-dependent deacetylase
VQNVIGHFRDSTVSSPDLTDLAARLRSARRLTVLTGAGVSAASGVPTFRGDGGLWRSFKAEDLATPDAFRRNPRLVWEWYDWRRSVIAKCRPNPAHDALARLNGRDGFTLVTQNVDGLHERAGSSDLIRLHGSIWHVRCAEECPGGLEPWKDDRVPIGELPPRCPHCRGLARPSVVWFGESLDASVLRRTAAVLDCDLFLSVGTSSVVYPAAGLVHAAQAHGAWTVEINPATTAAAAGLDMVIAAPAEEVLPQLVDGRRGAAPNDAA